MTDSRTPDDGRAEFPGRTDVLFRGAHVVRKAEPAPSTGQAWYDYTIGYKEAADILVGHVESTGRRADKLGYPILFLYRHHLELVVKSLIRTLLQPTRSRTGLPAPSPA
jgi:hypothetical protein